MDIEEQNLTERNETVPAPAEEKEPEQDKAQQNKSELWGWIRDILIAVAVAAVILTFIKPTVVQEHSMEPTLYGNDYVLLSRQAYRLFGDPAYEDIIVFHSHQTTPEGKEKLFIKRVIGLPGDEISITGGKVYRNGEMLSEQYTKDGETNGEIHSLVVPEGELFVMGDNRLNSNDSRNAAIGCVPIKEVVGKAFVRLYPFNAISGL